MPAIPASEIDEPINNTTHILFGFHPRSVPAADHSNNTWLAPS
jgi:hypothetical protein